MTVEGKYQIEIDGQGYMLSPGRYNMETDTGFIAPQPLRGQPPGTASQFWWQKVYTDFVAGYDQRNIDAEDSAPNKFLDSSGIDVSTPGEFKLLPTMTEALAGKTGDNLRNRIHVGLGKIIFVDNGLLNTSADGASWSEDIDTGLGTDIRCQADDGTTYYCAGNAGGVRISTTLLAASFSWLQETHTPADMVYVEGLRSVYGAHNSNGLIKITNPVVEIDSTFKATGFNCVTVESYQGKIVYGGYKGSAGDEKSYVWQSEGVVGDQKLLIDDLPTGFKIQKLFAYSDVLWILGGWETVAGSAAQGGIFAYINGQLTFVGRLDEAGNVGDPAPAPAPTLNTIPLQAFAFGQYVYFSMNEGTGLWRYDLREGGLSRYITVPGAGDNLVNGAVWFKGKEYISYSGASIWTRSTSLLSTGSITLSSTRFESVNEKVGRAIVAGIRAKTNPTVFYAASALPAASSPAWTKATSGAGQSESVSGGVLTTAASGVSTQDYTITDGDLDTAVGTTMETRLKVISTEGFVNSAIRALYIQDGTNKCMLVFYSNQIRAVNDIAQFNGVSFFMDTTDDFHVYRLTLKGTAVKVYVDGTLKFTHTITDTSASQKVAFGDFSGSNNPHEEQWDYVSYWETGALTPGDLPWATSPIAVEVSLDQGETFISLSPSTDYRTYNLGGIKKWQSLMPKITVTDSNAVVTDVAVEAAPTFPPYRWWDVSIDLRNDVELEDGQSQVRKAQLLYEALETAWINRSAVTFKDMDYDIATTKVVRNVVIEKFKRGTPTQIDRTLENMVTLTLREL